MEIVSYRVVGEGPPGRAAPAPLPAHAGEVPVRGRRPMHFRRGAGALEAAVVERGAMGAGAMVDGPCVIEEPDATIVVPPGHRARHDGHGHLLVEVTTGEEKDA